MGKCRNVKQTQFLGDVPSKVLDGPERDPLYPDSETRWSRPRKRQCGAATFCQSHYTSAIYAITKAN